MNTCKALTFIFAMAISLVSISGHAAEPETKTGLSTASSGAPISPSSVLCSIRYCGDTL